MVAEGGWKVIYEAIEVGAPHGIFSSCFERVFGARVAIVVQLRSRAEEDD